MTNYNEFSEFVKDMDVVRCNQCGDIMGIAVHMTAHAYCQACWEVCGEDKLAEIRIRVQEALEA